MEGEVPWKRLKSGWNKTDEASLAGYIDLNYKLYAQVSLKKHHLKLLWKDQHPVKDYLLTFLNGMEL